MSSLDKKYLTRQPSLFHLDPPSRLFNLLSGDLNFHDEASGYASHNFHSFPAKFPPQLPKLFIEGLTESGEIVLDPMVGSGTTVLEGFLAGRRAIGFDIDPLAVKISRVKTTFLNPFQLYQMTKTIIFKAAQVIQDDPERIKAEILKRFDDETLKFIQQWFLPAIQLELQAIIQEVRQIENLEIRNFFEVSFSGMIITKTGGVSLALDLGHTRPHLAKKVIDRTGQTVYGNPSPDIPHYATKTFKSPLVEFEKRCMQNLESLSKPTDNLLPTQIHFGNAQNLPLPDESVDLIVTSPPYASNAIDYMRAHKFSLIWLGYPIHDLGKKRGEYIGGESVQNFHFEKLPVHAQSVVNSIFVVDPKKSTTLHRYYSEMMRVTKEMVRVLKPGKAAVLVIGNSIMRGIDTETAMCLREIGEDAGFQVARIGVRLLDRNKRMMPAGTKINKDSQIQQRMHEEFVIGFYKP